MWPVQERGTWGGEQALRRRVAALEAEATAAAAAASVAKSAAAASEERLGEAKRERAAACRAQRVRFVALADRKLLTHPPPHGHETAYHVLRLSRAGCDVTLRQSGTEAIAMYSASWALFPWFAFACYLTSGA